MSTPKRATTVDTAYHAVNPDIPLEPGDPRYVDLAPVRGDQDLARVIARRIRRTPLPSYHKQLVTGHRGCGKSTELKQLQSRLKEARYLPAYLDVEEVLDLGDLEYLDVLVAIARAVDDQARQAGLKISPDLLDNIGQWFAETVLTKEQRRDVDRVLKAEYGVGLDVKLPLFARMMAAVTGQIKSGGSARAETRRKLERRLPVLMERINELVNDVQVRARKAGYEGLVVIVDGLEKVYYRSLPEGQSTHSVLFVEHAEQLKAPDCHVVYTVPISLLFNVNLDTFVCDVIPAIKLTEDDGQTPCPEGRGKLFEIISRRIKVSAVFENEDVVWRLVEASGGYVRDLLRLVRLACDHTTSCLTIQHAERAVKELSRAYERLLRDEDLPRLVRVHRERRMPSDEEYSLLLFNRLVLDYLNDDRWSAVHPVVLATRTFREYLAVEQ